MAVSGGRINIPVNAAAHFLAFQLLISGSFYFTGPYICALLLHWIHFLFIVSFELLQVALDFRMKFF